MNMKPQNLFIRSAAASREVSPMLEIEPVRPRLAATVRGPARIGFWVILIFLVGSLGWASVAPLASGAVATGIISPDGSRRTVQHLEGGIIQEIKAKDGDEVSAGQVLVTLRATQTLAMNEMLTEQAQTLQAMRARLLSEQSGMDQIVFPAELLGAMSPLLEAMLQGQTSLFEKRGDAFRAQLRIIENRVAQFYEQIGAFQSQLDSASAQITFVEDELKGKESLFKRGLTTKTEVLRLERSKAALFGERGKHVGAIAEVKQRLDELATQKISLEADRAQEISTELERLRTEYAEISERLNSSRDILERTTIIAPVSGKVVNSRFKTTAGVIKPGEPIMDIVPTGERLLIDVHISPRDIDIVRPQLPAIIHLTAYSSRGLPRINGFVRDVSADSMVDQVTGQSFFLARVEVLKEDLSRIGDEYILLAGMPAEVMIVTGERTVVSYLLEPFLDAFRRGLRES
ncbi:HlyD family type I secretion periplasmic adaptor subunit [Rhizobium skierniewicense]|uniref:HlyD family type I secretion periplasmic adaptor subunit n=1 Tax=Rhizobium skierniewicense TaxID=984260 RepID=UPI001FAB8F56|nr:HlyD family type I secretion periplasmic adaptor subunit [Rhizobium skierniewicense]